MSAAVSESRAVEAALSALLSSSSSGNALAREARALSRAADDLEVLAAETSDSSTRHALMEQVNGARAAASEARQQARASALASKRSALLDELPRRAAEAAKKDEQGSAAALAKEINDSLRRTTAVVAEELDRSIAAGEVVEESSRRLRMTRDQHGKYGDRLASGGETLGDIRRTERIANVAVVVSFVVFFAVAFYVAKQTVANSNTATFIVRPIIRVALAPARIASRLFGFAFGKADGGRNARKGRARNAASEEAEVRERARKGREGTGIQTDQIDAGATAIDNEVWTVGGRADEGLEGVLASGEKEFSADNESAAGDPEMRSDKEGTAGMRETELANGMKVASIRTSPSAVNHKRRMDRGGAAQIRKERPAGGMAESITGSGVAAVDQEMRVEQGATAKMREAELEDGTDEARIIPTASVVNHETQANEEENSEMQEAEVQGKVKASPNLESSAGYQEMRAEQGATAKMREAEFEDGTDEARIILTASVVNHETQANEEENSEMQEAEVQGKVKASPNLESSAGYQEMRAEQGATAKMREAELEDGTDEARIIPSVSVVDHETQANEEENSEMQEAEVQGKVKASPNLESSAGYQEMRAEQGATAKMREAELAYEIKESSSGASDPSAPDVGRGIHEGETVEGLKAGSVQAKENGKLGAHIRQAEEVQPKAIPGHTNAGVNRDAIGITVDEEAGKPMTGSIGRGEYVEDSADDEELQRVGDTVIDARKENADAGMPIDIKAHADTSEQDYRPGENSLDVHSEEQRPKQREEIDDPAFRERPSREPAGEDMPIEGEVPAVGPTSDDPVKTILPEDEPVDDSIVENSVNDVVATGKGLDDGVLDRDAFSDITDESVDAAENLSDETESVANRRKPDASIPVVAEEVVQVVPADGEASAKERPIESDDLPVIDLDVDNEEEGGMLKDKAGRENGSQAEEEHKPTGLNGESNAVHKSKVDEADLVHEEL